MLKSLIRGKFIGSRSVNNPPEHFVNNQVLTVGIGPYVGGEVMLFIRPRSGLSGVPPHTRQGFALPPSPRRGFCPPPEEAFPYGEGGTGKARDG